MNTWVNALEGIKNQDTLSKQSKTRDWFRRGNRIMLFKLHLWSHLSPAIPEQVHVSADCINKCCLCCCRYASGSNAHRYVRLLAPLCYWLGLPAVSHGQQVAFTTVPSHFLCKWKLKFSRNSSARHAAGYTTDVRATLLRYHVIEVCFSVNLIAQVIQMPQAPGSWHTQGSLLQLTDVSAIIGGW